MIFYLSRYRVLMSYNLYEGFAWEDHLRGNPTMTVGSVIPVDWVSG